MSCKVFVDLQDSPSCPNTTVHSNYCLKLISSIAKAFLCRRLKSLKLCMATLFIFVILFFVFRPTNHEQSFSKSSSNNELNLALNGKAPSIEHVSDGITPKSIEKSYETDRFDEVIKESSYVNNLTHFLSMSDFLHMKNVNLMQVRIKEAAKHSWDNYKRYAWGYDMLKPRSKEPDHWFDLGLTIVDSADSLLMLGLEHEAQAALDWMENELIFSSKNENSNCFELTIRILGGLLSAYHLSGREKLRLQSIKMGDVLLHCYNTESKIIPYSDIDLNTHRAHPPLWNPHSSLSEVASLQLEFRYLSQISGDQKYEDTTFQTSIHLHNLTIGREHKLLPMYINPNNGKLEESSIITLGARSDSYYEYLLKQYLQTGIKWLEDDYLDCVDEMASKLFRHTNGRDNYTYVAEMHIFRNLNDTDDFRYYNKMDHLVCFLPGTLALGYYHFSPQASEYRLKHNLETPETKLNPRYDYHLGLAQDLARTCYHMYSNMGTGLSPEIANFVHSQDIGDSSEANPELQVQSSAAHNILRPEFVESLFYLYHITGLPIYRDQATQIFESFQKYSRISSGYTPISDVRKRPSPDMSFEESIHKYAPDRMESFWLSETLKYLYLIFCDDRHIVGTLLNDYVFNTEAHALPILRVN